MLSILSIGPIHTNNVLDMEGKIMKKILRNSLLVGAALLGIGSFGFESISTKAATTPATTTSKAGAVITPGTISLDSVPGATASGVATPGIDFGTVPSSAGDVTYKSTAIASDLHVTNPGQGTGWSVSVADSPFTDGTNTLKNAQFSFTDASAVKADATDNVSTLPTFSGSVLVSSAPVTVLNAATGTGVGAYTASYGATDASLLVPAGNIGGSYSSTLTWTLSDAPA